MTDPGIIATWVADHLAILGWPTLIGMVWKLKGAFDKYNSDMAEARTQAALAAQTGLRLQNSLDTIQNNHLLHLSQDVKEIHDVYDRHTELLTSIDRGIAVLVDRGKNPPQH